MVNTEETLIDYFLFHFLFHVLIKTHVVTIDNKSNIPIT